MSVFGVIRCNVMLLAFCFAIGEEVCLAVKVVIKGVYIIPMGFANTFLIEDKDGLTLIAGFPHKEAAVFATIRGRGYSPEQLKYVIFTQGQAHISAAPMRS